MTLAELIAFFRAQSKDEIVGHGESDVLCSDALLTIYANEAQDEACRRAQLLRDSASPVCELPFKAGDSVVGVDDAVLWILAARLHGKDMRLLSDDEMRANRLNWRDDNGVGVPTHLVHGLTTGSLHLWPIPEQDGLIRLTAQRLPIKPLRNPGDKPEIRRELHPGLVDWMLYRAYSREDTDLYNDTKAAVALGRFEAEFGRKASGRNEQWVRDGAGVLPGPIA